MSAEQSSGEEDRPWPEVLAAAVEEVITVVGAGDAADWSSRAGRLDWDCRATVLHLASDFVAYAGQLTAPRPSGYVPFDVVLDGVPEAEGLAEVVRATGGILYSVARTTSPGVLSWHPYGMAGPADFCAMGATEALVHAHDLSEGLRVPWEPPAPLAARVLDHLFAGAVIQSSPGATLLRLTGRVPDDTGALVKQWRWKNTGT